MDIQTAKNTIKNTIQAYLEKDEYGQYIIDVERQRPIFLLGAPGIGKTAIMKQIAEELQLGLVSYSITHHTRQSALGLPFIVDKKFKDESFRITEYTMSEIIAAVYHEIEKSGNDYGILFIDEINSASETLAPTMLQFLQSKVFGTHRVPSGWVIVAAGNPPEYNKSVKEFDIVTMDRVKKMVVEADYNIWKKYAYSKRVHISIINYLDLFNSNFYFAENSIDGMRIVTPRGWEDLSMIIHMYEKLKLEITSDLIVQYLQHPKVAKEFYYFYSLFLKYKNNIDLNKVLNGTLDSKSITNISGMKIDEKIAIIGLITEGLSLKFFDNYISEEVIKKVLSILKKYKSEVSNSFHSKFNEQFLRNELESINIAIGRALDSNKKILQVSKQELIDIFSKVNESNSEEESYAIVKKSYDNLLNKFKGNEKQLNNELSNALNFVEDVFGDKNELFIFITELTINPYSIDFLNKNKNVDYLELSKKLMIGDQSRQIFKDIEDFEKATNLNFN